MPQEDLSQVVNFIEGASNVAAVHRIGRDSKVLREPLDKEGEAVLKEGGRK